MWNSPFLYVTKIHFSRWWHTNQDICNFTNYGGPWGQRRTFPPWYWNWQNTSPITLLEKKVYFDLEARFFFSFRKLFSCLLLGDSAVTLIFVSFFYRTQLPVKLRNRVRMNAIEPSDMFEYISRHFKAYNFNNMQSIQAKSLYISHVVSNFHGTQIEIWAGSRPVGNSKKNKKQGWLWVTF